MKNLINPRRNLLITKFANVLIFVLANLLILAAACSKKDDADTTAPKLPEAAALNLTTVTPQGATVVWPAATDDRTPADKLAYQVLWQAAGASETQNSGTPQAAITEYNLTGLTEKTTYKVWVTVKDEAGNKAEYAPKEFTTPLPKDTEAPKVGKFEVTATAPTTATAKWEAATDNRTEPDKLKYQVLWNIKGSTEVKNSGEAKEALTEFNLTGLTENTTYEVKITVTDEEGNTAHYEAKELTTPLPEDEEAPSKVVITISNISENKATVTWTPATDNRTPAEKIRYKLNWKNMKLGGISQPEDIVLTGVTTYELTELTEDTQYVVSVEALDEANKSSGKAGRGFKTANTKDTQAPSAVTITVKNVGYENIAISWTLATDNRTPAEKIRYKVSWVDSNGAHATNFITETSYEIKDLNWNTEYNVCVEAYDEAGNKSEVCKTIRTLKDKEDPSKVIVTISNVSENKATITWTPATDNRTSQNKMRYKVRWTQTYGAEHTSNFLTGVTSYDIKDIHYGTSYYVAVSAYDEAGNNSISSIVHFKTPDHDTTPPSKVAIKLANIGENKVTVNWSPATDNRTQAAQMRYEVTIRTATPFSIVYQTIVTGNSYEVLGLKPHIPYVASVAAIDEADNKGEEVFEIFGTLSHDSTRPVIAGEPSVENIGRNNATVKWPAATDNRTPKEKMKYKLTLKKGYTIISSFDVGPNVTSYTFTNLDSNGEYYVWIEAIDEVNNYSNMIIANFKTKQQ